MLFFQYQENIQYVEAAVSQWFWLWAITFISSVQLYSGLLWINKNINLKMSKHEHKHLKKERVPGKEHIQHSVLYFFCL